MTGPYIIEVRNDSATIQTALDATAAREARIQNPDPPVQVNPVVSRRAVGTLDEANREVTRITRVAGLCDIGPEGGTVNLRDGTTITVKPTTWKALADDLGYAPPTGDWDAVAKAYALDEWNRAHDTKTSDAT